MPETVIQIEGLTAVQDTLLRLASPAAQRAVMEAVGADVRNKAIAHFRAREQEPEKTDGFPKFGQAFGKRGFWAGTKGTSVAEAVGAPDFDAGDGSVTVPIDSPALAHKADPNPPLITPKGGRKFLAIPANARAAAWQGMPRDFDVSGGLVFGMVKGEDGRLRPALVAKENHLRSLSKGARKGLYVKAAGDKATAGAGAPQYWLVRRVQTAHDPRAMPDTAALSQSANARAASVIDRLFPPTSSTPNS